MKKTLAILLALIFTFAAVSVTAAKEELVIYSCAPENEAENIAEGFSAAYPEIECTIIQVSSGDAVTRVNTEWPQPEGDVLFLIASENLDSIYDKLHAYRTVNDASIKDEYKDQKSEDPKYYASSMPLQAIMYNTDLLTGDMIPTSWKDLADPKYNGMIELANPATSGSAYAQLFQMNQLYGWDFVKSVVANGTVYVSSSTKGPNDVARGEFALTVTGEANIAQAIADGDPVAYVHPEEGTGLRVEGCAILENCKNLDAAQKFMDYMTSLDGLNRIAELGRRPVSEEANTPANLPALSEMKFYEYNTDEAKANKKQMQEDFGGLL